MLEGSLVTGWLPAVLTGLGFTALAGLALLPRPNWRNAAVVAGTGLLVVAMDLFVTRIWRPFPDALPVSVLVWSWLGLCGLTLAAARLVRWPGWGRAALATLAGLIALVGIGAVQVNRYYGQYPTVGTALGLTKPRLTDLSTVERADELVAAPEGGYLSDVWSSPAGLPEHGIIARVEFPATQSGFRARPGYVYLPPGYSSEKRPLLPVLVLLAGQPGNADSWLVSGRLAKVLDEFAARHGGLAPVVVMADNLGANFANPLCVDSKRGNVETYLARDVPAWVRANLQVATDRTMWAIAGLSNGGTCALQLAVRAPEVYGRFIDISGEYEPLDGTKQQTIDRVFDGDAARYAAINPVEILARQRFPETSGRIVVGTSDGYREQLRQVMTKCEQAGMRMSWLELPGGHTWQVWAPGLAQSLDWLARETRLIRG